MDQIVMSCVEPTKVRFTLHNFSHIKQQMLNCGKKVLSQLRNGGGESHNGTEQR